MAGINFDIINYMFDNPDHKWDPDVVPISLSIDVDPGSLNFDLLGFSDFHPQLMTTSSNNVKWIQQALQLWADVIERPVAFTAKNADASITVNTFTNAKAGLAGITAAATLHSILPDDADVFLTPQQVNPFSSDATTRFFFGTMIHEIGHAFGLHHPGDYNDTGATYEGNRGGPEDTSQFSIMSYFDPNKFDSSTNWTRGEYRQQTPMVYDIYAMQQMYGLNETTRTGNTVYGFGNTSGNSIFDFSKNQSPVLTIWDAGGFDTLDASGFSVNQAINLHDGEYSSIGVKHDGKTPLKNNVGIAYLTYIEQAVGGSGNDHIYGNQFANILRGGAGNDTMLGSFGKDTILGGAGHDIIGGDEGDDNLDGGDGNDDIFGGAGDDTLTAGKGATNRLYGGDGDDTLFSQNGGNSEMWGGTGTNEIYGANGNDHFVSEAGGTNTVNGKTGDDLYTLGDGADSIADGKGYDTIELTNASELNWVANVFTGDASNDSFNPGDFDEYVGTAGDEAFVMPLALGNKIVLRGNGGNDVLSGGGRKDLVIGGTGDDVLRGSGGDDLLRGGYGIDTANFDDHFGAFSGGWDINLSTGTASTKFEAKGKSTSLFVTETDTLKSIENVSASNGDDTVTGNKANNYLDGLNGIDTISFADHAGNFGAGWTIDMIAGTAITLSKDKLRGFFETDTFKHFESVIGSSGGDKIQANEGAVSLLTAQPVKIPIIDGGAGIDTLTLAPTIFNPLVALKNADADDVVTFNAAKAGTVTTSTTLISGGGLFVSYEAAQTWLNFKNIEKLDTGAGNDKVSGSAAADIVFLGSGEDTANMGAGDDIVEGGDGGDILTGGAGKDQFSYTSASQGGDVITDFEKGDVFSFASVTSVTKGLLKAANFVANDTGTPTQAGHYFVFNTSDHALLYDPDGNGLLQSYLIATLSNNYDLKASDILIV